MYILIMDPKAHEINLQKNTVFKKGESKSEIKSDTCRIRTCAGKPHVISNHTP